MYHLRDNHAVESAEGMIGDEDDRFVISRDVFYAFDGRGTAQLLMNDAVNELVAFEVRVFAQEGVHLLDMNDTLQVPNDEIRYMRLWRLAFQDCSYVKLQGQWY